MLDEKMNALSKAGPSMDDMSRLGRLMCVCLLMMLYWWGMPPNPDASSPLRPWVFTG